MADKTGIEWTDATWNPVRGCSRVSEGCRHCYAETVAARFSGPGQPYEGLVDRSKSGSKWTGVVRLIENALDQPLRWRRPRRIFVNSMSDLFHEALSDDQIARVFAVMALCPQHTFQILTKRPERMREIVESMGATMAYVAHGSDLVNQGVIARGTNIQIAWPLPNVWLGVSVEDQKAADLRIPDLLATPAAVRFLSCEPLLGPVQLDDLCDGHKFIDALRGNWWHDGGSGAISRGHPKIDWVIAGGESGPGARPMHPDWARGLRDQCQAAADPAAHVNDGRADQRAAAGVPFFFKQWGEFRPDDPAPGAHTSMVRVGKKAAGALLDGREHREFPEAIGTIAGRADSAIRASGSSRKASR